MRYVIEPKNPDHSVQLRTGVVFNEGMISPYEPREQFGYAEWVHGESRSRASVNDVFGNSVQLQDSVPKTQISDLLTRTRQP